MKRINREAIQRMVDARGGKAGGTSGGGGGSLAGYATQAWVNEGFVSIDFFNRLFTVYGPGETSSDPDVVIEPNDLDSTIKNIKAMFGFWTEYYVSALGNGGDLGSAIYLSSLADVALTSPISDGQVLQYNLTTGKWTNATLNLGSLTLSGLSDVLLSTPSANQVLLYDGITSKWINSDLKTINGQSVYGSGDIQVGGGASGNYLPLTGGTLVNSNNILTLQSSTSNCWQYFKINGTTTKASVGYYDGISSIAEESTGHRIGITNDGKPMFREGASSSNAQYELLHLGNIGGKTISYSGGDVLNLNSTSSNSLIYFKINGTNKAAVGYYGGNAFLSIENGRGRIGVNADDNLPIYMDSYNSANRWRLCYEGSSFNIYPQTGGSYNEGIRLHPYNGWCALILCDENNSGRSGTSTNTWGISNNNGRFFINKNSADGETGMQLCNISGNWGIGTSSPSYKLHVSGTIYATGSVTALSDARKKDERGMVGLSVEQVAGAPAVQFLWKGARASEGLQVGTLAQYWQGVLPEVVMDKGGELSMQYGVAALVSAIITARKVVDHERRISQLESRLKIEN